MASTGPDKSNSSPDAAPRQSGVDSTNPFIRFKQHIDAHMQRGFDTWSSFLPHPSPFAPWPTWQQQQQQHHHHHHHPTTFFSSPATNQQSRILRGPPPVMCPSRSTTRIPPMTSTASLLWAVSSPYSPLNLQHLPPPRPASRDLPAGGASDVSFRTAFEDLLVAAAADPSLQSRSASVGPSADSRLRQQEQPLHVADWVADLHRRGLWPAYHAGVRTTDPPAFTPGVLATIRALIPAQGLHFTAPASPRARGPAELAAAAARQRQQRQPVGEWGAVERGETGRRGREAAGETPSEPWREKGEDHRGDDWSKQQTTAEGEDEDGLPMHELELMARLLGFSLHPSPTPPPPPYSAAPAPVPGQTTDEPPSRRTAYSAAAKQAGGAEETVEEETRADGSRTVTTTTTSGPGRVAVRRESFNPQGDLVSSSSETRVHKSFSWSWPPAGEEPKRDSSAGRAEDDGEYNDSGGRDAQDAGRGGWFWTR